MRDATPADALAIASVRAETWKVAYAHLLSGEALAALTAESAVDWWSRAIREPFPSMHTIVAEIEGAVTGFASLGAARDDDVAGLGELFAIYVLPDAWGSGVGRTLLAETLARLRSEGFAEAILWVFEDNPRTRRFYERAGWHADGGVKDEEWLGAQLREIRYRISLG